MSVRRSFAISFAQRYLGMFLALATTAILARLLTPSDFGLYGIALGLLSIITLLCEFGVAPYIVQHRQSDDRLVASAFWLSVTLSWFWCAATILSADLIAAWFGQPTLGEMLRIMALALLVEPFKTTINALLQRSMRFGAVASIALAGVVGNLAVAVALANLGFGAPSLAWGYVGLMAGPAVVCLFYLHLFPFRRPHLSHVPSIVGFGGTSTMVGLFGQVGMMLPNIIIGRTLGVEAAGYYNRGFQLFRFASRALVDAARPVALATLSQKRRAQQSLHEPHMMKMRYLSVLSWPLGLFLIILPETTVFLVLGGQWEDAAGVVRIFSLIFLLTPLVGMNFEFYIATGRLGLYARQEGVLLAAGLLLLAPAAFHSVEAVAASFVAPRLIALYMTHRDLHRPLGCSWNDVWRACSRSAGVTAVSTLAPLLAAVYLPSDLPATEAMAMALTGFGFLWLGALFAFGHPLARDLGDAWLHLRRLGRSVPATR